MSLFERWSIPARAGEPGCVYPATANWTVYPRACGGTTPQGQPMGGGDGLSPRVRGNHHGYRYRKFDRRSIPARAGEPRRWCRPGAAVWVYPRACGGTVVI